MALINEAKTDTAALLIAPKGVRSYETIFRWPQHPNLHISRPPFGLYFEYLDFASPAGLAVLSEMKKGIETFGEVDAISGIFPFGARFSSQIAKTMDKPHMMYFGQEDTFQNSGPSLGDAKTAAVVDDLFLFGTRDLQGIDALEDQLNITTTLLQALVAANLPRINRQLQQRDIQVQSLVDMEELIEHDLFRQRFTKAQVRISQDWYRAARKEYS